MAGTPTKVRAEIAMTGDPRAPAGGDWVDLTDLAGNDLKVIAVSTKLGTQRELGRVEAGEASVVWHDPKRKLDPNNPLGTYAGKIDEQRPIRLWVVDRNAAERPLWRGFVREPSPKTTGYSGHVAELRCFDPIGALAQTPGPATALEAWLVNPTMAWAQAPVAANPRGWWRFDELAGAVVLADSGPLAARFLPVGGVTLGAASLTGDVTNTAVAFNGSSGYLSQDTNLVRIGAPFTIGFWMKCPQRAGTAYRTILHQLENAGTGLRIDVQDASNSQSPGELIVSVGSVNGGLSGYYPNNVAGTGRIRVDDNAPHYVMLSYYSTSNDNVFGNSWLTLSVDGLAVWTARNQTPRTPLYGQLGAAGSALLIGAQSGGGTTWYNGSIDELVILSGATTDIANDLVVAAKEGVMWRTPYFLANHYPDDRARGLLDVAGWPAALRSIAVRADAGWSDRPMTGLKWAGGSLLGPLLDAAAAEGGSAVATPDGLLQMLGRLAQPAASSATWGEGAGELEYESVELARSQAFAEVDVARAGEWSVLFPAGPPAIARDAVAAGRFGKWRRLELELALAVAADRQAEADRLLALLKAPATRIRSLVVNPGSSDAAADAALNVRQRDLWRVKHTPPGSGYTLDATARVVGVAHRWQREKWRSQFWLDPV